MPRVAVVSGGARGLGRAIVDCLGRRPGYFVIDTRRGPETERSVEENVKVWYGLDISQEHAINDFVECCLKGQQGLRVPDILVNNAAICVPGAGREILKQTLQVNFHGPARLSKLLMHHMAEKCEKNACGGIIINISSGDGELACLNSELRRVLEEVQTEQELNQVLADLCEGKCLGGQELAFGPTPAYSVSKAALNVLTRLQANEMERQELKLRSVAVCPGDVDTRMCTAENGEKILTPQEAAENVVWAIERPLECPSGGFYRDRQAIPW
mmetsp:Transcript_15744/g.36009  ORF Transcript_15744/g.36009 Transcript_15744/m.36009 type:complete len:271 (-) Transcript_15744:733-1545(-)